MCREKWQKILFATQGLSNQDIIDTIKENLKEECPEIYVEWYEYNFDVNHLFIFLYEYITDNRCTLLHIAAYYGLESIIEAMLTIKDVDVNVKSQDGNSALHLATKNGHIKAVKILLENGANVDAKNKYVETPLHWAAEVSNTDMIEILLKNGAEINVKNEDADTSLHLAAESGDTDVAKILLENGADVNVKNEDGETPLHWAVENGHIGVVNALLKKRDVNVNIKDEFQTTPLHLSILHDQTDIAKILLAKGANSNAIDIDYETPLHHAVFYDHINMIKILLAAGAKTSLQNIEGDTPINLTENDDIKHFFKNAEHELSRMKNEKIGDTDVSFYEFLQAGKASLKNYARNSKLCAELRKDKYKNDYPIYASMMDDQYKIIERRYLKESARIAIGCFGTHVKEGKGQLIYTVISEEVCRLITSYLTDIDLVLARKSVVRDEETRDYVYYK